MIKAPEYLKAGDQVRVNGCIHGPNEHSRDCGDVGAVRQVLPDTVNGQTLVIYVHFTKGPDEFFYGPELDLLS